VHASHRLKSFFTGPDFRDRKGMTVKFDIRRILCAPLCIFGKFDITNEQSLHAAASSKVFHRTLSDRLRRNAQLRESIAPRDFLDTCGWRVRIPQYGVHHVETALSKISGGTHAEESRAAHPQGSLRYIDRFAKI